MPTLYYVPIIHSDKDLAEVGTIIKDLRTKIYGREFAKHDEKQIEELWQNIRAWVLRTIKDISGLIIYQDGMPAGPREKIRKLFDLVLSEHPESPLFRLTKELLDKGAVLEGTEDINLVLKRSNVYKEIYECAAKYSDPIEAKNFIMRKVAEQDELILQADQFIAKRINETLPEDGRGVIFMGYRHEVDLELVKMREANLLRYPIEIIKLRLRLEKKPTDKP